MNLATNHTNHTRTGKYLKLSFVSSFVPFVAKEKTLNSFLATNHTNFTRIAKDLKYLFVSSFVYFVANNKT